MSSESVEMDQKVTGRDLGRLLVVSSIVGLFAGAGVIVFLTLEGVFVEVLWTTIPNALGGAHWWWVYLVLILGAVGVWAAQKMPGGGGHSPLDGLSLNVGLHEIAGVLLAAIISLSVGAVVGPEAPLMALGSAVGAAFALKAPAPVRTVLMTAGAAAAVTMILGNPMVAAVLVLEGAALSGSPGGKKVMLALLPVLMALGFGYLIQVGFGNWGGVGEAKLGVPGLPAYDTVQLGDLAMAFVVGIATSLLAVIAIEAGTAFKNRIRNPLMALIISGAIVATAAIATRAITGQDLNVILFSGEDATATILGITSASAVLVIALAKTIAYSVSLGGGFRGGMIFPAVFLGVVVATCIALVVPGVSLSALTAAGIAAAVSSVMRLPFTGVLLALLLCAGAGLAVTTPAIIGSVVGVLVRVALDMRVAKEQEPAGAPT